MTKIRIERVYESERPDDGFRVLVDKLWPRGVKKADLVYDLWAKEITPTDALRRWYHADPEKRWAEFRRRYTVELENSPDVHAFVHKITGRPVVTLLFASKNAAENHALVLQEFLQKTLGGKAVTAARSL